MEIELPYAQLHRHPPDLDEPDLTLLLAVTNALEPIVVVLLGPAATDETLMMPDALGFPAKRDGGFEGWSESSGKPVSQER